jgi:hypothetical protein
MASDTTITTDSSRWPLLESAYAAGEADGVPEETGRPWRPWERTPFAQAPRNTRRRKLPRSAWLLTGLAFLCGGLVSAAGFSIGWRHQAQRDTAAQTALAAATARTHRLSTSLAAARRTIAQERRLEATAVAAVRAASRNATSLATEAGASGHAADTVSASAGDIAATSTRVTRELQTLLTYLTTTPSGQIDSGYVASQAAYLTRQLAALQDAGTSVTQAVVSFDSAVRRIARSAAELSRR